MNQATSLGTPGFERTLLRLVGNFVPRQERAEWLRAWKAELWYVRERSLHRHTSPLAGVTDLWIGLTRDALWLRTESWRLAFSDTAALCLASLLGLSLLSLLVGVVLVGGWGPLLPHLRGQWTRSLIAAPHVVFVLFVTASRRHAGERDITKWPFWIRRQLFFAVKIGQVLLLAFVLSVDLCVPFHASFSLTADLLQLFTFVFFALIGLRWAIHDQEQRCKHCLRSLNTPARVGRPSRNLLEWNGSELNCKQGHGLLSVPEMETSWCRTSHWIDLSAS